MEVKEMKELIAAVSSANVDEFEYNNEEFSIRIAKKKAKIATVDASVAGVPVQSAAIMPEQNEEQPEELLYGDEIKAPLVGTFYVAPSEGAEPFVSVGDKVKKGQVIGIVEAMKLMNEVESEYDGTVAAILVENGEMASGISSNSVMMINSKGMTQSTPARDSISTDSFMTTSSNGYAVTEKKQTQGTYVLGTTSTESVKVKNSKGKEVTKESRLTVYGSNMLIDEQITSSFSSLENLTLFTNSVTASLDNADNVSISPKSLEVSYNTIAHPGPFSILVVFVIPVGLIIGGFIVWFRRRRR